MVVDGSHNLPRTPLAVLIGLGIRFLISFPFRILGALLFGYREPTEVKRERELREVVHAQRWRVDELEDANERLQRIRAKPDPVEPPEFPWIRDFMETRGRKPTDRELRDEFPYLAKTTAWRRIRDAA